MAKVLVVEDDHAICELISEALADRGFAVDCAKNDREAYARIAALPPLDGLVLDVNLGEGTTGYDVARFARRVASDIAVVYVSGDVSPNSFKASGVPGSVFIEKPITPAEVADALAAQFRPRA